MAFQKVVPVGTVGQLSVTEAAGVATLAVGVAHDIGGGQTKMMLKDNLELDIPFKSLVDLGFAAIESHLASVPMATPMLESLRLMIDAQI